ncbi:hypothetical protein U1Q18_049913 [Sarracenia purpurea var. burkii]
MLNLHAPHGAAGDSADAAALSTAAGVTRFSVAFRRPSEGGSVMCGKGGGARGRRCCVEEKWKGMQRKFILSDGEKKRKSRDGLAR